MEHLVVGFGVSFFVGSLGLGLFIDAFSLLLVVVSLLEHATYNYKLALNDLNAQKLYNKILLSIYIHFLFNMLLGLHNKIRIIN